MPVSGAALLLITLLLFSGCTALQQTPDDYAAELSTLLAAHDYRTALERIDSLPPDDPRRMLPEADIEQLRHAATGWRREQLAAAWQLAEAGQWRAGARLLAAADAQLPEDLRLIAERATYTERQYDLARERMIRYALLRARHLATERPALMRAEEVVLSRQQLAATLERHARDREQVLSLLTPAANTAMEQQRWQRAVNLFSALLALDPPNAEQLNRQLQKARTELSGLQDRQQQRQARARQEAIAAALHQADMALAMGDYHRARKLLEDALTSSGDDPQLQERLAAIHSAIRAAVRRHLADGDRLYASGSIEAALHAWRRAEQLQPGSSEIEERIQRALRFIERYHTLKPTD